MLVEKGFKTFGLDTCEEENIYAAWMYKDMQKMYETEPADFLVQKSITRRVNNENNNVRRKILREKNAVLRENVRALKEDKRLCRVTKRNCRKKRKTTKEIDNIKQSKAYRLGNKLLWLPRKVIKEDKVRVTLDFLLILDIIK